MDDLQMTMHGVECINPCSSERKLWWAEWQFVSHIIYWQSGQQCESTELAVEHKEHDIALGPIQRT